MQLSNGCIKKKIHRLKKFLEKNYEIKFFGEIYLALKLN